jgi:MFS family permease
LVVFVGSIVFLGFSPAIPRNSFECLYLAMLVSRNASVQLIVIVFAQFAGTSLWFAGNAILPDLQPLLQASGLLSWITSSVQIGFIMGTLLYALLGIPDRFRTTLVFLVSVSLAAAVNLLWTLLPVQAETVLASRFLTGFFLAGVYPVGMKIAADQFTVGMGKAMGFLVGALVIGTAFPHLLRGMGSSLPYRTMILSVSLLAISGGLALFVLVPAQEKHGRRSLFSFRSLSDLAKPSAFRPAMLGYFGHMWELYTVWAFLPPLLVLYNQLHPAAPMSVSIWAFWAIAAGTIGCVGGGYLTARFGSAGVARAMLAASGLCILLTPLALQLPPLPFALFLISWGATAAGDSPQFSTLVASRTDTGNRGSILTLVTCVGFLITVLSLQLMAGLTGYFGLSGWLFYCLLPGPVLGLLAMKQLRPVRADV